MKRYENVFGKEQVKIIIFEELFDNKSKIFQDLLSFLEIDYHADFNEVHNSSLGPRNLLASKILTNATVKEFSKFIPISTKKTIREKLLTKTKNLDMSKEVRNSLITFYKEDVKNLEKYLGKNLPWKNI